MVGRASIILILSASCAFAQLGAFWDLGFSKGGPPAPPPENIAGWWKFNEGSGTNAFDSAGSITCNLFNGVTWGEGQVGGAIVLTRASSQYGRMLTFPALTNLAEITVTMWVKAVNWTNSQQETFYISTADTTNYIQFQKSSGNNLLLKYSGAGVLDQGVKALAGTETNTWHHLALTVSAGADRTISYWDGAAFATNTVLGAYSGTNTIFVGRDGGGNYTDGSADDLRIYSAALSAARILAIFNRSE